nr:transglycosylase SLT domain-containing protein [uncultured Celeribacter sp.]
MKRFLRRMAPVVFVLGGLSAMTPAVALESSVRPVLRPYEVKMPKLRWHRQSHGPRWTRAAMHAIASHGQALVKTVPQDIRDWCPGYVQQTPQGRAAFWAGLLSTLSYHESTWRETAVGGGGRWFGLVQIAPRTAQAYQCRAGTGEALKDGVQNLSCAVRIMNRTVARDGVVSAGMRGVAADWGPFHSRMKREDMRRWIAQQPYCRVQLRRSPIPLFRPEFAGPPLPAIWPPVLPAAQRPSAAPDLPDALFDAALSDP